MNVNDQIYEYEQIYVEINDKETRIFSFNQKFGKKGNRILDDPFEINFLNRIKYEEV